MLVEAPTMRLVKLFFESVKKTHQHINKNCVQKSLQNLLLIAQLFGHMPVLGVTKNNIEALRFEWISFRTAYAALYISGASFVMTLQILKMRTYEISLGEIRLLVFYICGVLSGINFFLLARKWHVIMRKWHLLEINFAEYGYPTTLHKTVNSLLTIALSTALCE